MGALRENVCLVCAHRYCRAKSTLPNAIVNTITISSSTPVRREINSPPEARRLRAYKPS